MTELQFEVEYAHPPTRVWRALTAPELLGDWFAPVDGVPTGVDGFSFDLDGLVDGTVTGEAIEVYEPHRFVMRWQAAGLQARVAWELAPTPRGCRVTVTQTGFFGVPAEPRREAWLTAYADRFGALPAVLDRLEVPAGLMSGIAAIEQLDERSLVPRQWAAGRAPAPVPRPGLEVQTAPAPDREDERPRWVGILLALGMSVGLIAATAAVVTAMRPEDVPGRVDPGSLRAPPVVVVPLPVDPVPTGPVIGTGAPTPARSSQVSPAPVGPVGPVGPVAGPEPAPRPKPTEVAARPVLTATYAVERIGLLTLTGYKVTAKIRNPGDVAVPDWTVTFTLPAGQTPTRVSGARYAQNGTTVTFTPLSDLLAHGETTMSFEVDGLLAGEPTGCTVDGRPCG